MLLDLHSHSKYSKDGLGKPASLVKVAAKKGIGFAITDHNNCRAWPELKKEAKKHNVPLILGEEIKVERDGKLLGEILVLFMNEPIKERGLGAVLDSARQQGALLAAAHPFDLLRKPFFRGFYELPSLYKKLDAIEVFNSRTIVKKFDARAKKFAKENKIPMICGSDAHTLNELGASLTEVKAKTVDEAKKEILSGRTRLRCRKSSVLVHSYSTMAKFGLKK